MVAKMSLIHESKFYVHIESMIQIRKIKNFIVGTARDSTILPQAIYVRIKDFQDQIIHHQSLRVKNK